jgi:hypothetical protein
VVYTTYTMCDRASCLSPVRRRAKRAPEHRHVARLTLVHLLDSTQYICWTPGYCVVTATLRGVVSYREGGPCGYTVRTERFLHPHGIPHPLPIHTHCRSIPIQKPPTRWALHCGSHDGSCLILSVGWMTQTDGLPSQRTRSRTQCHCIYAKKRLGSYRGDGPAGGPAGGHQV